MIYDIIRRMFNREIPAGNVNIFTKPYIFLITSTIRFSENPLSYSHSRSVFSAEERLEQTLHSIKSIRTNIPDAIIILLENSNLFPKSHVFSKIKQIGLFRFLKTLGLSSCVMDCIKEQQKHICSSTCKTSLNILITISCSN